MDLGNSQSLSTYSYVLNNPLGWVDPSGLDVVCTSYYFSTSASSSESSVHASDESTITDCFDFGGGGGAGGGGTGIATVPRPELKLAHNYVSPDCVLNALTSNAVSLGIDALGIALPEARALSRFVGQQRGYPTIGRAYHGIVADQAGAKALDSLGKSVSTAQGLSSLSDISLAGLASTTATVVGLFKPYGQAASAVSLGIDAYKTYKAVAACYQ